MSEYSMTQLSMKQNLLESQIKHLKRLNVLLAEMAVLDMDKEVLNSIQDICKAIIKCSLEIKDASDDINSYAFLASIELKDNDAVQAKKKFPAIDIDGDEGEYVLADKTVNRGAL